MTTNQKKLFIGIGMFLFVVAVASVIYLANREPDEPDGSYFDIANIDEYTEGQPTDKERLNYIKQALYAVINMNLSEPVPSNSVFDINIRDGSFTQQYDEEKDVHTVDFIVDIESLKQSYNASYQWSDTNKYSENIDEWGTVVKCLPEDKLIYGDFDCKDMFTQMENSSDKKLDAILPYNGTNYRITHYTNNENPVINVRIMLNNNPQTKKFFNNYRKEANSWLRSHDVAISDYTITYRDLSNTIVATSEPKVSEE